MANKSFVVQYLIKARQQVTQAAKKSSKAFRGLNDQVKRVTASSKKLSRQNLLTSKTFSNTSASIVRNFKQMGVAALGFFGLRAFATTGTEFQNALLDLSAITGATGKNLAFLREEAFRLSVEAVVSSDKVLTAFKLVASAKPELLEDAAALSAVTEQVLLLANASGLELSEAALVTAQSMNQFGAAADQAARFVNILAAGSKLGSSEVGETGAALLKVGAIARSLGISFEEANAAVQVLAKGGIKGELAGTGLKTAFIRLEKEMDQRLRPSLVGISKALENLNAKNFDTIGLQKIFGDEALAVGTILAAGAIQTGEYTKQFTGTNIALEQAKVRLSSFSKTTEKLGVVMKNQMSQIFLKMEPRLQSLTKSFTRMFEGVGTGPLDLLASGLNQLIDILRAAVFWGRAFGDLFGRVGSAIGQTAAALTSFDFSQFQFGAPELAIAGGGTALQPGAPIVGATSATDVSVTVGLEEGLRETQRRSIVTTGGRTGRRTGRRADVGAL